MDYNDYEYMQNLAEKATAFNFDDYGQGAIYGEEKYASLSRMRSDVEDNGNGKV